MGEARTFFREFTRTPKEIGSITPSSKHLAALMVESAEIEADSVIVELGAGTGPMTRRMLEVHPDNPLLVLEPNPELAAMLRAEFTSARVEEALAQDLPQLLQAWGHPRVDRVVSSLPFAAWDDDTQAAVFDALAEVMAPDARLVTFTYVHSQLLPAAKKLKKLLESRFSTVRRSRNEMRNVPPAFVWICEGPLPPA